MIKEKGMTGKWQEYIEALLDKMVVSASGQASVKGQRRRRAREFPGEGDHRRGFHVSGSCLGDVCHLAAWQGISGTDCSEGGCCLGFYNHKVSTLSLAS